jgi:hypothetical protein
MTSGKRKPHLGSDKLMLQSGNGEMRVARDPDYRRSIPATT